MSLVRVALGSARPGGFLTTPPGRRPSHGRIAARVVVAAAIASSAGCGSGDSGPITSVGSRLRAAEDAALAQIEVPNGGLATRIPWERNLPIMEEEVGFLVAFTAQCDWYWSYLKATERGDLDQQSTILSVIKEIPAWSLLSRPGLSDLARSISERVLLGDSTAIREQFYPGDGSPGNCSPRD